MSCLRDHLGRGGDTIETQANAYVIHSEEKAWDEHTKLLQKKHSNNDLCFKRSAPQDQTPPPNRGREATKAAKTHMIPSSGKIYSQASWKNPRWELNPLLCHADTGSTSLMSHNSHQHTKQFQGARPR